jgi:hypothetical protein
VALALITNAFIVALWWRFDLPIGIVPPLMFIPWISLAVRRREPAPRGERRMLSVGVGLAAVLTGIVLVVLFFAYP